MTMEHTLQSCHLGDYRRAWIHRTEGAGIRDCLLFLDGELYRDRVKAPAILEDASRTKQLPPVHAVFISSVSAKDRQINYICHPAYAAFVADEVPAWIRQQGLSFDRLYLCGLSLSGLQALFTSQTRPGVFDGVLSQSPSAWWNDEWLASSLHTLPSRLPRTWISVGLRERDADVRHPPTDLHQKTSQLESVRRLVEKLRLQDVPVQTHEYDGGHDCACWGEEMVAALAWLLQPGES